MAEESLATVSAATMVSCSDRQAGAKQRRAGRAGGSLCPTLLTLGNSGAGPECLGAGGATRFRSGNWEAWGKAERSQPWACAGLWSLLWCAAWKGRFPSEMAL